MTDPYKVLGLERGASYEEIRSAYRDLARTYQPGNYADLDEAKKAAEKMKEINAAYDAIINSLSPRQTQQNGNTGQAGYSSASGHYSGSSEYSGYSQYSGYSGFGDIRRLINANRLAEAEELLNGVPANSRNAEWYFLKATLLYSRGWLDEAFKFYEKAAEMDPQNDEYRTAYANLAYRRQHGADRRAGRSPYVESDCAPTGCCSCDMCTTLLCADCCCECMGGDLIRCI